MRGKSFARIQSFLTLIPVLPAWLNSMLIACKFYRIMPSFGMLTHSIARVLDRHKEFDVDGFQFKMRYRIFMTRKTTRLLQKLFHRARAGTSNIPAVKTP